MLITIPPQSDIVKEQGLMGAAGRIYRVPKEGLICSFICLFLFSIKDLNTICNTWKETGSEEEF